MRTIAVFAFSVLPLLATGVRLVKRRDQEQVDRESDQQAAEWKRYDMAKLKSAAKALIVDGEGTGPGAPYLASVDSIDRPLHVYMRLGSTSFPGKSNTLNRSFTCNREWYCPAQRIMTCPGAEMTTAMARHFHSVPTAGYDVTSSAIAANAPAVHRYRRPRHPYTLPRFYYKATPGKKYSIIFADFLSPKFTLEQFFHWAVLNIRGSALSTGIEISDRGGYFAPANPYNTPNLYTFMLFEHDTDIPNRTINAAESVRTRPAFKLSDYVTALGLSHNNLRGANWMRVRGSVYSMAQLKTIQYWPDPNLPETDFCSCVTSGRNCDDGQGKRPQQRNGKLNMCRNYDSSCREFRK